MYRVLPCPRPPQLVRVDFNVPQDKKTGAITNTQRIDAAMPTIKYALEQGAQVSSARWCEVVGSGWVVGWLGAGPCHAHTHPHRRSLTDARYALNPPHRVDPPHASVSYLPHVS